MKNKPASKDKKKSAYNPLVPSVEQALKILFFLAHCPRKGVRLKEICEEIGLHYSKGYTLLNTLEAFDIVERNPDSKAYSIGVASIFLARQFLNNLQIPEVVAPFLEQLSTETESSVFLNLIRDKKIVCVAQHKVKHAMGINIQVGFVHELTHGAHGKAIVAFMPENKRKEILAEDSLCFYGDGVSFDMRRLMTELSECREKGFAKDPGEVIPGINAISSPIFGVGEELIGDVTLIGTYSIEVMEEYGLKLFETARKISTKLGADLQRLF